MATGRLVAFFVGGTVKRKPIEQTELEKMEDAAYPVIMASWHGIHTPILVRKLTQIQTWSCGDFGLIELWSDKLRNNRQPTLQEMNAYAERHHKICKLAMVKPTYDEAMKIAGAHIDTTDVERQLKEIKDLWKNLEAGPERKKCEDKYNALELASKFLLPADFTAIIVEYSLGIIDSDIKKVTEEMLMNAAILASRGHDNPSDHMTGVFTDFMRREIDNRAWVLLDESQKKKTPQKKAG